MKLKTILTILIAVLTMLAFSYQPTQAQGPFPTVAPPIGYGKETNGDWFEICSAGDYEPLTTGFYPTEYPPYAVPPPSSNGTFRRPIAEWFGQSFSDTPPVPYIEDAVYYVYPEDQSQMCIWDMILVDDFNETAYTPYKSFSHEIEYGDVSFSYDCTTTGSLGGITWVPYQIEVIWDDGLTTTDVQGTVCFADGGEGYVSKAVLPRGGGEKITDIRVVFINTDVTIPFLNFTLPQPNVAIDNILIRGFYQTNPPTPTPTRTPSTTRTPAPSRTPTETTTPRSLWDTPTATTTPITTTPTMAPTKVFPWSYGVIPTRIPPVQFPAWPTPPAAALLATPAWSFSLPLIPTPPPLSPTVTLVPIITPAPFFTTPTITPTATITVTGTVTPTSTPTATPTREDIISTLNLISTQLMSESVAMQTPTTFTISAAPDWYAPSLPRNIAAVGYTIENMDTSAGLGFGITAWASLFGYIVSLPFQVAKMLYNIFMMMGPLRLFIAWLLLMLPFILWVRLFLFIKNLIISIINLIIKLVQFIGDLWDLIPFG